MVYDPRETEISQKVLGELLDRVEPDPGFGIVGGWAVHALVGRNFREATGREYLKSRDIDVFIDCKGSLPHELMETINEMGFTPGEYKFRYKLIFDRENLEPLPEEEARKKQLFELSYLYLDVLGNKQSEKVGVIESEIIKEVIQKKAVKKVEMNNEKAFVPREDYLFLLKTESLLGRKSKEKRMKDACDVYALLFYSDAADSIPERVRSNEERRALAQRAMERILGTEALDFLATELFRDELKVGLIRRNLMQVMENLK